MPARRRSSIAVATVAALLWITACGTSGTTAAPPAGALVDLDSVGTVDNSAALVAVVSHQGKVAAYVCDGGTALGERFTGTVDGTGAQLRSGDGATLALTLAADGAHGTFTPAGGQPATLTTRPRTGDAGLFFADAGQGDYAVSAGWIALPDGRQTGVVGTRRAGKQRAPAILVHNDRPSVVAINGQAPVRRGPGVDPVVLPGNQIVEPSPVKPNDIGGFAANQVPSSTRTTGVVRPSSTRTTGVVRPSSTTGVRPTATTGVRVTGTAPPSGARRLVLDALGSGAAFSVVFDPAPPGTDLGAFFDTTVPKHFEFVDTSGATLLQVVVTQKTGVAAGCQIHADGKLVSAVDLTAEGDVHCIADLTA